LFCACLPRGICRRKANGCRAWQVPLPIFNVFEPDYVLLSLPEVEAHIAEHGHLHDTPSGAEIEANGLELGSMMANQQAKIEELYLHLIEMNQRVAALEAENARLRKKRSKRQRS